MVFELFFSVCKKFILVFSSPVGLGDLGRLSSSVRKILVCPWPQLDLLFENSSYFFLVSIGMVNSRLIIFSGVPRNYVGEGF